MQTNRLLTGGAALAQLTPAKTEESAAPAIDGKAALVTGETLEDHTLAICEEWKALGGGFHKVGARLKRIRDTEEWHPQHASFKAYVRDRLPFTPRRAYQLIDAEEMILCLGPMRVNHGSLHERVLRELLKVPEQKRREVFAKAEGAAQAICSPLTAKILRQVAREVCPELKSGAARKPGPAVKIGCGIITADDIWRVFTLAKADQRAEFLYRLQHRVDIFSKSFKGCKRKLALVEATKKGKPRKGG